MYISIAVLIIFIWFFCGVLYRERIFHKAATVRAEKYNQMVNAMIMELGESQISIVLKQYNLPLSYEPTIQKGIWGSRLGW